MLQSIDVSWPFLFLLFKGHWSLFKIATNLLISLKQQTKHFIKRSMLHSHSFPHSYIVVLFNFIRKPYYWRQSINLLPKWNTISDKSENTEIDTKQVFYPPIKKTFLYSIQQVPEWIEELSQLEVLALDNCQIHVFLHIKTIIRI